MPKFLYIIGYFVPASYYINISCGIIIQRGAGLSHLRIDALALFALGAALSRWLCLF